MVLPSDPPPPPPPPAVSIIDGGLVYMVQRILDAVWLGWQYLVDLVDWLGYGPDEQASHSRCGTLARFTGTILTSQVGHQEAAVEGEILLGFSVFLILMVAVLVSVSS